MALGSAVVLYLLRPRKEHVMSNSIIRPTDCCDGASNPVYAPMSKMGLKLEPVWERKSAAGFLSVSAPANAPHAA